MPMTTYEIHHSPDSPYWVVERRHDGETYASTGTELRAVSGPWLSHEGARDSKRRLEEVAAAQAAA